MNVLHPRAIGLLVPWLSMGAAAAVPDMASNAAPAGAGLRSWPRLVSFAAPQSATRQPMDMSPSAAASRSAAVTAQMPRELQASLAIADELAAGAAPARALSKTRRLVYFEASVAERDSDGQRTTIPAASVDYLLRSGFATSGYGLISGRLDGARTSGAQGGGSEWIHTLRELAGGWQFGPRWALDAGRINAPFGEGIGFNPTDLFKAGALRNVTSVTPASLRNNRQGAVMLRGQHFWTGGALTGIYAPRIRPGSRPATDTFSLDLASTNPTDRWLIAASQKLGESVTPQVIVAGGKSDPTQVGVSVSWLPVTNFVAYVEAGMANRRTTLSDMGGWVDDTRLRTQTALGATWTATDRLTLTLEYDQDGTAPDRQQQELVAADPALLAALQQEIFYRQSLPYRHQLFASAMWRDAFGPGWTVTALTRLDAQSLSGQYWMELRKAIGATEFAAQLLFNRRSGQQLLGTDSTELRLLLDHYF